MMFFIRHSIEITANEKKTISENIGREKFWATQNFGWINIRTEKSLKFCPSESFGCQCGCASGEMLKNVFQ